MLTERTKPSRPCHRWPRTIAVALALAALLAAAACAEVERTAVRRTTVSDGAGGTRPALIWESDRYPTQQRAVSDQCWDEVTIGESPPDSCISPLSVFFEGNAYGRAPGLALAGSLIVIAGLLWFALRQIAWLPDVPRPGSPQPPDTDRGPADVIQMMRAVDEEKGAQAVAEAAGHDIEHPVPVGLAVGVVLVAALMLLFGYGTTLGWAAVTALILFGGIGIVELLLTLPTRPHVADLHPAAMRMLFLGGVAAAFLGLAIAGTLVRTPLLDLHGVAWPL